MWQHKNNAFLGFTAKYHVHQLVYYEEHQNIYEATRREKRMKNGCRKRKLNWIEQFNSQWRDLYQEICSGCST
jgi:putative endonuclease